MGMLEDLAEEVADAQKAQSDTEVVPPAVLQRQFSADADMRRWMTAAKAMMPIMSAALTFPVKTDNSSDITITVEDVAHRLMTLLKATAEITSTLEQDIAIAGMPAEGTGHRWTVRNIFSIAANLVAQQYRQHGSIDTASLKRLSCGLFSVLSGKPSMLESTSFPGNQLLNEKLAETLSEYQNLLFDISEEEQYKRLPPELAVQLAMDGALSEMIYDVSQFNLCASNDDALEFALQSICYGAKTLLKGAYRKYLEQEISEETRTALIQSCFDKSRRLLQGAWQIERHRFYNKLGSNPPDLEFYKNYKKEQEGKVNIEKNFNETLGTYIGACQKGKLFVEALLFKGVFEADNHKGINP